MQPTTIGPFQIQRELGRGGMGEVFLARDTRLDRHVAIKALPVHLAQDADRLARFQREAKVLASLNHPSIGAIYGLEEANGHLYLILEYVEGESLSDRLAKGPIPVDESLSLAKQIAEALEVAHEKGVIHRDLKPGNVMVTPDGAVKVLDFGLARTSDAASSSSLGAPDSPTMQIGSPTIPGAIMGTAGYMSPEQARGKPVDKRSDIFSFGCVLYEMLTGAQPFRGETVADAIGATLHKESDLNLLPPNTPRRVRDLLTNCLAKDKKSRLNDIGDARLELERAINGREWASVAPADAPPRRTRLAPIGAACALVLLAGSIGWLAAGRFTPPAPVTPPQTFHVSTTIPSKPQYSGLVGISPDSKFVVYLASPELDPESVKPQGVLVLRRLDRDETTIIEGTEGATNAALSPDGRWLAFCCAKDRDSAKFSLKKVAIENGRPASKPQIVCELVQGAQFTMGWASDREILFATGLDTTVYAVSSAGGEPRVAFREERSRGLEGWDTFYPLVAGKSALATSFALLDNKVKIKTEVIDLASGTRTVVLPDFGMARLVSLSKAGGREAEPLLIAVSADMAGMVAVRFDVGALRTLGDPVTVWNGGQVNRFDLSSSGTLAMMTQTVGTTNRRLAWIDEKGQPQPLPATARTYTGIAVSPDGGRVLATQESSSPDDVTSQVWLYDLTRKTSSRISLQGFAEGLVWSNDGRRFAYVTLANDEFSIRERPATPIGEAVQMFATPVSQQAFSTPNAWSPDGKILAVALTNTMNTSDVLMLEQAASGSAWKATPYLNSPADEHALRFSPDGKWVVFCSVETGRHELYVQRFTGTGSAAQDAASGRVQVSTNGHDGGVWWSADGKEMRYLDADKQAVSVEVNTEPTFSASVPRVLYSLKDLKTRSSTWAPDGRLMVILEGENERASRIDLVVNFEAELRTKMSAVK